MTQERNLVELLVVELLRYVADDQLPSCYRDVDQYLYDFYPSLSWSDTATDLELLLNHTEYPKIDAWFKDRYGFNLEGEIRTAIHDLRTRTDNAW